MSRTRCCILFPSQPHNKPPFEGGVPLLLAVLSSQYKLSNNNNKNKKKSLVGEIRRRSYHTASQHHTSAHKKVVANASRRSITHLFLAIVVTLVVTDTDRRFQSDCEKISENPPPSQHKAQHHTMVAVSPAFAGRPSCCNLLFFSAPLLLLLMLLLLLPPHASVSAEPVRLHGLNYNSRKGPDWDPDRCKTYAEIKADLSVLGRLTDRVRILSMTDCDQGELVWTVAKELGMRLWLGLWVGISGDTVFDDEVEELTRLLGVMDASDGTVLGVTVGSEVLYRKDATEEKMIQNMNRGERNNQQSDFSCVVAV